jgi:FkbM family methyltransferase
MQREDIYAAFLRVITAGRGVAWRVDDSMTLRLDPRCRWIRDPNYEKPVVSYLRSKVQPGDVCIDVGAHVGFYVLQFAAWTAPSGHVVAFEPNPTARAVLESNLALNHMTSRVTVERTAVGEKAGIAELFHSTDTSGLSRLAAPNPEGAAGHSIQVPVTTLDAYCEAHAIRPSWLLVDVEGAELSVLKGAAALIRNTPINVVVEMHPSLWDDQSRDGKFEAFVHSCGRRAVGVTNQRHALQDYGTIALVQA